MGRAFLAILDEFQYEAVAKNARVKPMEENSYEYIKYR
jgi:hypothetical protein